MIGNIANWSHYGLVSIAGPATNIGMGIIYFMIALITGNPTLNLLALVGVNINASLALFNLIPIGIFDGAKIIKWNRLVWGAAVLAAGLLFLITRF
jgi:Zn-dependent protease